MPPIVNERKKRRALTEDRSDADNRHIRVARETGRHVCCERGV
jgi:hypothetical protein